MEQTFKKNGQDIYPQKIFAHQLITVDDLLQFKKQLLEELLAALKSQAGTLPRKWMKSHEVRKLLKISPGTLQTLKSSGIIPYTKMGGVHFYDYEDIQRILQAGKINNIFPGRYFNTYPFDSRLNKLNILLFSYMLQDCAKGLSWIALCK